MGFDAKDLLDLVLNVNSDCMLIPAHIWTPWFSVLGSQSGFDSIKECYEDLSSHIYAIETGLSSDPDMNRLCSFLDEYAIISNSDAHSPENLGREANIFDTEMSYNSIMNAIKTNDSEKFKGTIEFFPQEGKYHYDGHRKCNIVFDPLTTIKNSNICPVCGKKLTLGVMHRVVELSDRSNPDECPVKRPFYSLIRLKELLSEITGSGENSKKVNQTYFNLINHFKSEFNILINAPHDELKSFGGDLLSEAISRMRKGEIIIKEGYDGEYGRIKVFNNDEVNQLKSKNLFFIDKKENPGKEKQAHIDYNEFKSLKQSINSNKIEENIFTYIDGFSLNYEQNEAVKNIYGPSLIIAGPGTGKTKTLSYKIFELIENKINPENILAVSFTNNACREIFDRLNKLINEKTLLDKMTVNTFHSFGLKLINEYITGNNLIISDNDKELIFKKYFNVQQNDIKNIINKISSIKQLIIDPDDDEEVFYNIFLKYNEFLEKNSLLDFDDLIYKPVKYLTGNNDILSKIREKYKWVIIDEYQDINHIQYQLIKLIFNDKSSNITAIGDPNQSIFGFRGSSSGYIDKFIADYPDAKIYRLAKSYRCTDKILKASNQIIGNENILSGTDDGINISINEYNTENEEAEFVAREIEKIIGGLRFFSFDSNIVNEDTLENTSLNEIAVLYRTNDMAEPIIKSFNNHAIPYEVTGKTPYYKTKPFDQIIDISKYLLNTGNRYLKDKVFAIKNFNENILSYFYSNKFYKTVEYIIQTMFKVEYNDNRDDFDLFSNTANECNNDINLFLKKIMIDSIDNPVFYKKESVKLLTMHSSKGLEFKSIFIIGCCDKYLPFNLYDDYKTDIEEEKRLFYAALTRSKKNVYISYPKKIKQFGKTINVNPSSFLNKIKKELIDFEKSKAKNNIKSNQLELF